MNWYKKIASIMDVRDNIVMMLDAARNGNPYNDHINNIISEIMDYETLNNLVATVVNGMRGLSQEQQQALIDLNQAFSNKAQEQNVVNNPEGETNEVAAVGP